MQIHSTLALAGSLAGPLALLTICPAQTARTTGSLTVSSVTTFESPKAARYPYLSRAGDRLLLSWVERTDKGQHAVRFTTTKDAVKFAAPRTVAEGKGWFVNWADFPSIVGDAQGNYAAHWLQKNGAGTYSYGVRIACSSNGGAKWTEPRWLHDDRSAAEHGFATLVPEGHGKFSAVWLDGRDHKATGNMALRSVRFDHTGKRIGAESLLDERTCECCATDAAWLGELGLVTVFRDRGEPGPDASELRDIAIIRRAKSSWTPTKTCHDDLWYNPG
jgi:hypothetical protein